VRSSNNYGADDAEYSGRPPAGRAIQHCHVVKYQCVDV